MKRLRFLAEAAAVAVAFALFKPLSPETASNLGGFLGRTLGPRLRVNGRARRNLRLALPELSPAEHDRIIRGMWDNLGRVIAEYPHLGRITAAGSGRIVLRDMAPVHRLRDERAAGILASAHLANWEILPVMAARDGLDLTAIVREPNNPFVRGFLDRLRGVAGGRRAPKGEAGAKLAMRALREGRVLGLLFDQKLNQGMAVPFFGAEAMTATAPALLALRFRCPLILVRIERTGPAHFRLTAHPQLALPDSGDRQGDVAHILRAMNAILEDWIRARPEDWFWLHRRWPEAAYAANEALSRGPVATPEA